VNYDVKTFKLVELERVTDSARRLILKLWYAALLVLKSFYWKQDKIFIIWRALNLWTIFS